MKATANIPPPTPVTVSIEMSEADARLLFTILGGANCDGSDFKLPYHNNYSYNGSVWDHTFGSRLFNALKPIIQGL